MLTGPVPTVTSLLRSEDGSVRQVWASCSRQGLVDRTKYKMTWEVTLTVPNQIGSMQGKEKKNPPMHKFDAMTLWQGTNGENGLCRSAEPTSANPQMNQYTYIHTHMGKNDCQPKARARTWHIHGRWNIPERGEPRPRVLQRVPYVVTRPRGIARVRS